MSVIYWLFGMIDGAIYGLIGLFMQLIFDLSRYDFFTQDIVKTFATRVYIVLGVVMLLYIVISCVQYLVNPDKFEDKEQGFGAIIKRTVIAVMLLALIPSIFEVAMTAQQAITKAIPSIILGVEEVTEDQIDAIGSRISIATLSAFVEAREGKGGSIGTDSSNEIHNIKSFIANIDEGCSLSSAKNCKYDYRILLSTITGGFLLYVLVSMALDIAIRSIKFGVIQLLAPIPVGSYILSKKNFDKFVKTSVKVYCDLFIRLGVVYFIVYFFTIILADANTQEIYSQFGNLRGSFILIFIICGLLMFAKNAPKFICDLLGLESSGDMKEMFQPFWRRAGGLAALGGMATAGVANMINKGRGVKSDWQKSGVGGKLKAAAKVLGSGVAGATSAGLHGGIAAVQGKNGQEVIAAGHKRAVAARRHRETYVAQGGNMGGLLKDSFNEYMGLDTQVTLSEGKQKSYATIHQDVGNYKKAVMGRIVKEADVAVRVSTNASDAMAHLGKLLNDNYTSIMNSGNADLINYLNKFEFDQTGKFYKLKKGATLSYHDIAAINVDASQAGIGSIATLTAENGALTLLAQKELMSDAMVGKVRHTDGSLFDEINVDSGKTHTDITTAVGKAKQDIAENALSIGQLVYRDQNGNIIKVIDGANELQSEFKNNFAKLDDAIQAASASLSTEMGVDQRTASAARTYRQSRNENNKK